MWALRDLSIKWKLMWVSMLASGIALLLICVAFVAYELFTFRDVIVRKLSVQAEIIGTNSLAALLFSDPAAAAETLAALRAEPHIISAGIYTPDGEVFATYQRDSTQRTPALPRHLAGPAEGYRFEDNHLLLFRRIVSDKQLVGTVYIQSGLQEMRARLKQHLGIVGIVALASFGLAFLTSSRLQRRISQPILHLVQMARTVSVEKDYAVRAVPDSQDEIGLLMAAFNDMLTQIQQRDAELHKAQDELEQRVIERTTQLEAANKELEAFTYTVSHDLRAPLRAIDGFSRILFEEHAPHLVPDAQRYLRLVRANTQQMGHLIDDLLAFSRLSRQPLHAQTVAPADLVRQVLDDLRATQAGRCIDIVIDDLPACQADAALLKQVLINLLSNAIKFTSTREVAQIAVGCQRTSDEQRYFIKDNGVGFDMRYADKLFGVFQRLHRAEEFEGTGVGLAIVQRIVHRHGGRIWAESAVDQGTTFYFTLGGDTRHG